MRRPSRICERAKNIEDRTLAHLFTRANRMLHCGMKFRGKEKANTNFINAHFGWFANDLKKLDSLLQALPNMYIETGAIIAELGRQPRNARAFLIKYQDRVMFGKDSYRPNEFPYYFRVLETADEYFDYYRKRHAFWKMYGLDLPDEVLKKLYYNF